MGRLTHRTALGTSYFVTTKAFQNRALFRVTEIAETLFHTLEHYRDRGEYLLHEYVLMPDHLHVMITPSSTNGLEKSIQFIKGGSSYRLSHQRGERIDLWNAGFHDWTIRDIADWNAKAQYIRENPRRAGLTEHPQDWPYSSANGRLQLDPMPATFLPAASGAKAQTLASPMSELKLRPPKERRT
jgi:putative transposase